MFKPVYINLTLIGTTKEQTHCGHYDKYGTQVSGCGKLGYHNYFKFDASPGVRMPVIFCPDCSKQYPSTIGKA